MGNRMIVDTADKAVLCRPDSKVDLIAQCSDLVDLQARLETTLDELQGMLAKSVEIIAGILEMRDPYTGGHQKRVAFLCKNIAAELGLSTPEITLIEQAALVHDIGKLYIPAEILNKTGKLTEAEYERIKLHPQIGYTILNKGSFFQQVDQIVWQHHERMNGSGYPRGLIQEQIRFEARILSVADVVDAMAVARPYRPALGVGAALDELVKNSTALYDKQVVQACLRVFAKKGFQPEETQLYAA